MTHESIVDRLSDYLDDELEPTEREVVAGHVGGCESCQVVLDDLRRIAAEASLLPAAAPATDLWEGIAARLDPPASAPLPFPSPVTTPRATWLSSARRVSLTVPQLAAAAILVMALTGGAVYLAVDRRAPASAPIASADMADAAPVAVASFADPQYDSAIADLEAALADGRSRLDPETVRVLEQNLASIDAAIRQCREALDADPANAYLNSHLASARQRKLALLRRAAALTAGS